MTISGNLSKGPGGFLLTTEGLTFRATSTPSHPNFDLGGGGK
jgi:hypothetical protein